MDLIRQETGRPKNKQEKLNVKKAAPREVFFQALTLFQKSDQLAFEFTGRVAKEPEMPNVDQISPGHVWRMLDAALERVLLVKKHLGINEKITEKRQRDDITPTDAFLSIVQANRQINIMLESRFSPSDVFERVTLATNYAARLLSRFPGAKRRPENPSFERRKVPPDVYQRLLGIFTNVKDLSQASGLEMLELTVPKDEIREATSSDVYDIASLLVSELSYIHSKCAGIQAPVDVFYPGRMLPSHDYQRAGILDTQILELLQRIKQEPDWLKQCG